MSAALPPGPSMPTLLQTLAWWSRPIPFLEHARAKYGKAFPIRLLRQDPFVMISDPAELKQVFTAPAEVLHPGEGAAILEPIVGPNSILLLDEGRHLAQRKLVLPAFHGDRMEALRGVVTEVAEAEIAAWPTGERLPTHPRVQALTLEVILRAVFGLERDEPRLAVLRELLTEMASFGTNPLSLLPIPEGLVSRYGPVARFLLARERTDEQIYALIADRRERGADGNDVLTMLLGARHEDDSPMSDEEIRDELMTLLIAGHETTATELAWCFERLVREPRVMARLVSEIDAGEDAYVTAVIRETLRRRPVLINSQPRKVMSEIQVGEHTYGPGCSLVPNAYLVQHDPEIYPEPYAFRPERFLESDPGTYTWIPFGGGRRRCIGASFAMLEMGIVLRALLSKVEVVSGARGLEFNQRRMITVSPSQGGSVELRPRAGVSAGDEPALSGAGAS
jgi:cytochrome P450